MGDVAKSPLPPAVVEVLREARDAMGEARREILSDHLGGALSRVLFALRRIDSLLGSDAP